MPALEESVRFSHQKHGGAGVGGLLIRLVALCSRLHYRSLFIFLYLLETVVIVLYNPILLM